MKVAEQARKEQVLSLILERRGQPECRQSAVGRRAQWARRVAIGYLKWRGSGRDSEAFTLNNGLGAGKGTRVAKRAVAPPSGISLVRDGIIIVANFRLEGNV